MGFIKSGDKYYKSLEIKLVVVNLIYSLTTVHITLCILCLLYIPHQWCNGKYAWLSSVVDQGIESGGIS
jgi:hypothetical protein